jgi:hypothetical protein
MYDGSVSDGQLEQAVATLTALGEEIQNKDQEKLSKAVASLHGVEDAWREAKNEYNTMVAVVEQDMKVVEEHRERRKSRAARVARNQGHGWDRGVLHRTAFMPRTWGRGGRKGKIKRQEDKIHQEEEEEAKLIGGIGLLEQKLQVQQARELLIASLVSHKQQLQELQQMQTDIREASLCELPQEELDALLMEGGNDSGRGRSPSADHMVHRERKQSEARAERSERFSLSSLYNENTGRNLRCRGCIHVVLHPLSPFDYNLRACPLRR